jgi:peptidoglycan/LPS O-acetylase OafA/YrhL
MSAQQGSQVSWPRFYTVDVLRGISILAVVLLHIRIRLGASGFRLGTVLPRWFFHPLFDNGNNGVTVFFAVSGFLITLTSLRRVGSLGSVSPRTFYRIRFARIMPMLLLTLSVLSVLHLLHARGFVIAPGKASLPRALFAALTFHLNWLEATRGWLPANWDVLWSLSVEEVFYLFFPLVCFVLFRLRQGTFFFVVLLFSFVAVGPFARIVWTQNPIWQEKCYLGGMDCIALGCLTALLTHRLLRKDQAFGEGIRNLLFAFQVAGAGLITLIFFWPRWPGMSVIGKAGLDTTIIAGGTCLVMIASVLRGGAGRCWTYPIRWFGRCSYEVYLTHEFIVVWGTALWAKLHRGPMTAWIVGMLLLTAPVGWAAATFFSEPLNRKLRKSRTAQNVPPAPVAV